jgi:PTS system cellobiose-specific IIC component
MSKLSERFEDGLLIVAEKVEENKYLSSVKNAFTIFMPFIIVGSFATLLNSLICSPTTGLAKWIPVLEKIKPAFTAVNFATMSFMTIPVIFLIAMQLAKANKSPEYITGVVVVASYISVIPEVVTNKRNSSRYSRSSTRSSRFIYRYDISNFSSSII